MNICIQINIDNEESKTGIQINNLNNFIKNISSLKNITIRGLMAIPSKTNILKEKEDSYTILRLAFEKLIRRISLNSSLITDEFINEITINEINSLIDYRLIKEEKTLLNRYIGAFNFCFLKNKVTELLSKNKIAWSELYSRPIIVFPVWKTGLQHEKHHRKKSMTY